MTTLVGAIHFFLEMMITIASSLSAEEANKKSRSALVALERLREIYRLTLLKWCLSRGGIARPLKSVPTSHGHVSRTLDPLAS
jgi:hypothetical protein